MDGYKHIVIYSTLEAKNKANYDLIVDWNKRLLPRWIEEGKLGEGTVPLKHFEGGIDGILDAVDYSRQGKVSGEKLVVRIV